MHFIMIMVILQQLFANTTAKPPLEKVMNALKESARDRARATIDMRNGNRNARKINLQINTMSLERARFDRMEPVQIVNSKPNMSQQRVSSMNKESLLASQIHY